jgi:hypothetical protein
MCRFLSVLGIVTEKRISVESASFEKFWHEIIPQPVFTNWTKVFELASGERVLIKEKAKRIEEQLNKEKDLIIGEPLSLPVWIKMRDISTYLRKLNVGFFIENRRNTCSE